MFGLFIPILVISVLAFMLAIRYQCSMADTIPVSYMLITVVLYVFYLFNILLYGYYLVVIIVCAGGVLISLKIQKSNQLGEVIKKSFSPILIVFLIALIVTYWYTYGNLIRLWDEQRLWGAYPKALWYTSLLQLGENSWLYEMESGYIPGMPIFVYFFEKGFSVFRENIVFFAYSFWMLGLFLPAFGRIKEKRHLMAAFFVMLLTPLLFFNSGNDSGNYYKTIFIEPPLGMTLAYLMYSMTQKHKNMYFNVLNLCLTLGTITLLKDIGILFAVVAEIGCLGMYLKKKKEERYSQACLILILLTPLIIYFSWSIITNIYDVKNHSANIRYTQLFDKEFLLNFIQYLLEEPIIKSAINGITPYLTIINILCFLIVGNFLIVVNAKKKRRCNYVIPSISMIFIQIFFLVGLYILCLTGFNKSILSVLRYESALLLGYFGFLIFISVDIIKNLGTIRSCNLTCIIIGFYIIIIFAVYPYRMPNTYINERVFDEAKQISEELNLKILVSSETPLNVFLVCDGWSEPLIHQRTYFNLIGKVKIKNYSSQGWVVSKRYSTEYYGEKEAEQRLEILKKTLIKEEYNYIYIVKAEDEFVDVCREFFGNKVDAHTLYKITVVDEKITLDIVN